MDATALLMDAAHRPVETARAVLDGISDEALHAMPGGHGNSIAWLIWHAARQWDYQLAELAGEDQVWVTGEWGGRLGIDRGAKEIGFGGSPGDTARPARGRFTGSRRPPSGRRPTTSSARPRLLQAFITPDISPF